MRALYITNKPIYPKVDGGCVAMDNFLKCLLQAKFEVKHLCISTNKHPFNLDAYPTDLQDLLNIEHRHIDTDVTPIRALKGLIEKGSYNINRFHSSEFKSLIEHELKSSKFDCVILESLYTTTYVDAIRSTNNVKIFVRTHNLEHKITSDLTNNASGLKKAYLSKLAKDLKKYEVNILNQVDGILSISEDDTKQMSSLGIKTPIKTIGVAIQIPNETNEYDANRIFHLGSMNWQPNIEAVERLLRVFPKIKQFKSDCELHIAGSSVDGTYKTKPDKHIFFDGFVDDINHFALKNGILITPIISGSGVRIKILEMMAIGIPIITTTLGALGINSTDSNCLLIAESDEEIIENALELIENKGLRKEIGTNAIEYIRKNHNIESISNDIIEFIEET